MIEYKAKWYYSCAICVLAVIFIYALDKKNDSIPTVSTESFDYDPCCSFPCKNGGICMSTQDNTYTCDCTLTQHYGPRCETPTWSKWLVKTLKPSQETVHYILTGYRPLWAILNNVPFIQGALMKYVYLSRSDLVDSPPRYESIHSYVTLDSYYNDSFYARELPPVPEHCPTPMGDKGPKELPDLDDVIKKLFLRRVFKPDPQRSNILFIYYAQHFTHQFFRTNYKVAPYLTKGSGGVDVSNIYGLSEQDRQALRSRVNGKLKTQVINGEEFPPFLKDAPGISMEYPPELPIPEEGKFALGHPFFALLPGLFVYSTIWVREHNRICDILHAVHPHWDDERLYQTSRLIIIGEVIKITIEDYVQHLSKYNLKLKFDPEVIHGTRLQFHNKIRVELDHLYHWHPLVPDDLVVNGTRYTIMDMAYSTKAIFKHGLDTFIDAMATSRAGALTYRNHAAVLIPILKKMLVHGRKLRFQSFNNYREKFQMPPYRSFSELTPDEDLAEDLKSLYGDIDALEFYVGLLMERPSPSLSPITMVNTGGPWSVKGLIANPICSPEWWKPSTFGGNVGFDMVKSATLQKLFCNNMKSRCKHIAFTVPDDQP